MILESPIGSLSINYTGGAITELSFGEVEYKSIEFDKDLESEIEHELNEYFTGKLKTFSIAVKPKGTEFENAVWNEVSLIPYGSVSSYGEIAKKLGDPNLMRAIGRANGKNPIPIIIPCHRVISAQNHLTGYSGGLERKRWLLQHEGSILL